VELIRGHKPLSLFFCTTIAQSEGRKSACGALATRAIKRIDQENVSTALPAERSQLVAGSEGKDGNRAMALTLLMKTQRSKLAPEPPLVPTILNGGMTFEATSD
jgi:hypothetical protein